MTCTLVSRACVGPTARPVTWAPGPRLPCPVVSRASPMNQAPGLRLPYPVVSRASLAPAPTP
ncbi:hypothetical protein [Streptomyces hokutonensis]|uniref:hypothetical protein n=1 Tax=Streptomyces hokutonensis TaxID=1306990 RepID=UPI0033D907DC